MAAKSVERVIVFTQENHTTDNYFSSMAAYGANVATDWPVQDNPPAHDQAHTRAGYAKWTPERRYHAPVHRQVPRVQRLRMIVA